MFTGIIETTGRVRNRTNMALSLEVKLGGEPLKMGESIAVDGVCLTVSHIHSWGFGVDVSVETFDRSSLKHRHPGNHVNLERALTLSTRLGGHMVTGHVDTTTHLIWRRPEGGSERWRFALPAELACFVAEKGSVTLDGVSLTVAGLGSHWFETALIPHTLETTTLHERRASDLLNFEVDILALYTQRVLTAGR